MDSTGHCLGICFAGQQLHYAVNDPSVTNRLLHIGTVDFNFDVVDAISDPESSSFDGVRQSLSRLGDHYNADMVRMLTPARHECWSVFPRLVYDTNDEREDHLSILMNGTPRRDLESTWFDLSNQDFKLLLVRNRTITSHYRELLQEFNSTEFLSSFELGGEWQHHTQVNGSYLTLDCHGDLVCVASYLLGKLRGATFIRFETINDMPYLWAFYGEQLGWMNGFHEQIYIYGPEGRNMADVMAATFKGAGNNIILNSLDRMNVEADETTYGFKLESAFPAVLLSLNKSDNVSRAAAT